MLAHIAKVAAAIIAIALFLEVFVFNINFYKSLGYNSIDLSDSLELQESSDEQYKITEVDNVIERKTSLSRFSSPTMPTQHTSIRRNIPSVFPRSTSRPWCRRAST